MTQVDWDGIVRDLGLGHPLKFLWEEKAHYADSRIMPTGLRELSETRVARVQEAA